MSDAAEKLKVAMLELPLAERRELLEALQESLPTPPETLCSADPALSAESNRRRSEIESGIDQGIPADEFFLRLRDKQA